MEKLLLGLLICSSFLSTTPGKNKKSTWMPKYVGIDGVKEEIKKQQQNKLNFGKQYSHKNEQRLQNSIDKKTVKPSIIDF